jgi:hypothetical protein
MRSRRRSLEQLVATLDRLDEAHAGDFEPPPRYQHVQVAREQWQLRYTLADGSKHVAPPLEGREVAERWAQDMAKDCEVKTVRLQGPLGEVIKLKG